MACAVPARRASAASVWFSMGIFFVDTTGTAEDGQRPLETNVPVVFAIGDVRSGSVKRVASAVGEGAQGVATLHAFLAKAEIELRR